jgi:hypothetical protein
MKRTPPLFSPPRRSRADVRRHPHLNGRAFHTSDYTVVERASTRMYQALLFAPPCRRHSAGLTLWTPVLEVSNQLVE